MVAGFSSNDEVNPCNPHAITYGQTTTPIPTVNARYSWNRRVGRDEPRMGFQGKSWCRRGILFIAMVTLLAPHKTAGGRLLDYSRYPLIESLTGVSPTPSVRDQSN